MLRNVLAVICVSLISHSAAAQTSWGLLANPGFDQQPVKATYFFAGNWNNGSQWYEYPVAPNYQDYTVYPQKPQHLGWSESQTNRDFALNTIAGMGFNVVLMSYWGARGTSYWATYAPMQTSTYAHDQLFNTAIGKNLLVMPAIESYPEFVLGWGLPHYGDPGRPPLYNNTLIGQIEDLVNRYVICPANPTAARCSKNPNTDPRWPSKWAVMYDQNGGRRYAINLLFVCSNRPHLDDLGPDQAFASAFDALAEQVHADTGIYVGFTLDIQSKTGSFCSSYLAQPDSAGKWLRQPYSERLQPNSVLAVLPFRDEIHAPGNSEAARITYKRQYIDGWVSTEIPVILDVTAGYDGRLVYPGSDIYGNNDTWRNYQSQLKGNGVKGIVFDAWNGFTEGWAGMPSCGGLWDPPEPPCGVGFDSTMYWWLVTLLARDPRECDNWQFVSRIATYHVYGDICRKWYTLGGSTGGLGDARSSEHDAAVPGVRVTEFFYGRIYWTQTNASKEVHGAIYNKYVQTQYETGPLGLPISDERNACTSGARQSDFQYGSILWSGRTGAHEVHGLIGSTYREMGYDCSWLGLPISDEELNSTYCLGGRRNRFERGYIDWCPGWSSGWVHQ